MSPSHARGGPTRPRRYRPLPPSVLVPLAGLLVLLLSLDADAQSRRDDLRRGEPGIPDSVDIYRSYTQTYASEDTLPIYVYDGTIEVSAKRMSLEEIIALCIEAEENKYADIEDTQFTTTERAVLTYGDVDDPDAKREVEEEISRTYIKRGGKAVTVLLHTDKYELERGDDGAVVKKRKDEENPGSDESDQEVEVRVESASDALFDVPFFFRELEEFHFEIRERRQAEARVLYRIAFTPRSDYAPLPTGEFWIDTHDFQLFHIDLTFLDNVPAPIILKGIDYLSIEKKRLDERWVYDRIMGRAQLRKIPFVPIPQTIEFLVQFDDYRTNQGLDLGEVEEEDR